MGLNPRTPCLKVLRNIDTNEPLPMYPLPHTSSFVFGDSVASLPMVCTTLSLLCHQCYACVTRGGVPWMKEQANLSDKNDKGRIDSAAELEVRQS